MSENPVATTAAIRVIERHVTAAVSLARARRVHATGLCAVLAAEDRIAERARIAKAVRIAGRVGPLSAGGRSPVVTAGIAPTAGARRLAVLTGYPDERWNATARGSPTGRSRKAQASVVRAMLLSRAARNVRPIAAMTGAALQTATRDRTRPRRLRHAGRRHPVVSAAAARAEADAAGMMPRATATVLGDPSMGVPDAQSTVQGPAARVPGRIAETIPLLNSPMTAGPALRGTTIPRSRMRLSRISWTAPPVRS